MAPHDNAVAIDPTHHNFRSRLDEFAIGDDINSLGDERARRYRSLVYKSYSGNLGIEQCVAYRNSGIDPSAESVDLPPNVLIVKQRCFCANSGGLKTRVPSSETVNSAVFARDGALRLVHK